MAIFIKLLQAFIGFLVSLFAMETYRSLIGGYSSIITLMLLAFALLRLSNPAAIPFAVGSLIGIAFPYVAIYGARAVTWTVNTWRGYEKDSEGRVIVDAVGVVVH